jgi:hypothetical protein
MSERIIRKIGKGNFYLLAFIVGFVLFYLFQVLLMYAGIGIAESKHPGFLLDFEAAISQGYEMTDLMWAVQNLSQFIGEILLAILMLIFLWKDLVKNWSNFKKELKSNLLTILFGFIIIYLLNIAMVMIYDLFGITGTSENQEMILNSLQSSTGIFMILTVMLLAPFVEEILFRKLLYGVVEEKFRLKPIIAVLISAIIFSALHAVDIFFFQYITMALVLCGTYALSKNNIFVPMGIHFLNNSTVIFYFCITVFR